MEGTETPLDRALRRRSLIAIMVHMTAIGLALGLLIPLNALVLEDWGVATWLNGLTAAMPSLAILCTMSLATRICGRLGTLRSIYLGCALATVAVLLMPLLPEVPAWMVLRFLVGVGLALPWLVGETWINALAPARQRGRVLAVYAASLFLGFALGPALLGLTGIEGWGPFLLVAGAIAGATLPIVWVRALAPAMPRRPKLRLSGVLRRAPSVLTAAFVAGLTESAFFALLPLHALRGGLPEANALSLLSAFLAGGILLQFPIGWLADRGGRRLLLGLLALVALGMLAVLALTGPGGLAAFVIVFLLGGMMLGFYSVGLALLGERFPVSELAVANAGFILLYEAGSIGGPTIAGAAMDLSSAHGLLISVGLALAVLALVALFRAGEVGVLPQEGRIHDES